MDKDKAGGPEPTIIRNNLDNMLYQMRSKERKTSNLDTLNALETPHVDEKYLIGNTLDNGREGQESFSKRYSTAIIHQESMYENLMTSNTSMVGVGYNTKQPDNIQSLQFSNDNFNSHNLVLPTNANYISEKSMIQIIIPKTFAKSIATGRDIEEDQAESSRDYSREQFKKKAMHSLPKHEVMPMMIKQIEQSKRQESKSSYMLKRQLNQNRGSYVPDRGNDDNLFQ